MAVTDFLKDGAEIPAGSALVATDTTTQGPSWLTDYTKQLLANQAATGGAAYSPYTGTRVAPFNNDQINSFQMTRNASGSFQPGLNAATDTANRAAGTSGSGQAAPYVNQAQTYTNMGAAQPGGVAYAQPLIGQGAGAVNAGINAQTGAQAGAQGFQSGLNAINAGLNGPGGMTSAMPWLTAASGNTANVNEYMNPYTDSVVNRIGDLGVRNLNEKIMPGLEGRYIKSGQFQGSGQMTDTARAIRDTSADILAAQSAALQQGYGAAQTAKAADLARYGTLGATAGQIGGQDRSTTIQGGTAAGNIGSSMASAADQSRQTTIQGGQALGTMGQELGALGVQDRNAMLQAGQQTGQLASTWGNLGVQDAQNLNTSAKTQADIAAEQQALALRGADAVNTSGNQQQALDQKNMETGYADYLRQQGWPQAQIDAQVATLKGLQPGMPSQVTEVGVKPSGVQPTTNPSTTAQIASLLAGAGGLLAK